VFILESVLLLEDLLDGAGAAVGAYFYEVGVIEQVAHVIV